MKIKNKIQKILFDGKLNLNFSLFHSAVVIQGTEMGVIIVHEIPSVLREIIIAKWYNGAITHK